MIYRFKLIVPLTYKDVEVESEEVELSDQEIILIKQLVSQSTSKRYGLMPILEDGAPDLYDKLWQAIDPSLRAPDLYDKLWKAIEQSLRDEVLEDGCKNGFVEDVDNNEELEIECVNYLCKIPDFSK